MFAQQILLCDWKWWAVILVDAYRIGAVDWC